MSNHLARAAEKCGFARDHYIDQDVPGIDNIVVVHSFGDLRSEFVLSSLILKWAYEDKYVVLCSWHGHRGLFPYVAEFWSPKDRNSWLRLRRGAVGFGNDSEDYVRQRRDLNYFFSTVVGAEELKGWHRGNGSTVIRGYLPAVPSATYLDSKFNRDLADNPGSKVLLMPMHETDRWFWRDLLSRLVAAGYHPVVVQNHMTHDLSKDSSELGIFVHEEDISKIICMMRVSGVVLDVFGGTSRLAIAARVPCVVVDGRRRYADDREFEVDAVFGATKHYIFGFPVAKRVDDALFSAIISKLEKVTGVSHSTAEVVVEVPVGAIKERKAKRLGARFVKIPAE